VRRKDRHREKRVPCDGSRVYEQVRTLGSKSKRTKP
jgi:hypothetical protein